MLLCQAGNMKDTGNPAVAICWAVHVPNPVSLWKHHPEFRTAIEAIYAKQERLAEAAQ